MQLQGSHTNSFRLLSSPSQSLFHYLHRSVWRKPFLTRNDQILSFRVIESHTLHINLSKSIGQ